VVYVAKGSPPTSAVSTTDQQRLKPTHLQIMSATDQAFMRVFGSETPQHATAPAVEHSTIRAGRSEIDFVGGTLRTGDSILASQQVVIAGYDSFTAPPIPPSTPSPTRVPDTPPATAADRDGENAKYLPGAYRQLKGLSPKESQATHERSLEQRLDQHGEHTATEDEPTPSSEKQLPASPSQDLQPLHPQLEVDRFDWPQVVKLWSRDPSLDLEPLRNAVLPRRETGERGAIVFATSRQGSGCTTCMLLAGWLIADTGRKVALVDVNFDRPHLASRLGIGVESGWEQSLCSGLDLSEVMIRSVEDGLVLVPLAQSLTARDQSDVVVMDRAVDALRLLMQHCDTVLLDFGSIAGGNVSLVARSVATLACGSVVVDPTFTDVSDAAAAATRLNAPLYVPLQAVIQIDLQRSALSPTSSHAPHFETSEQSMVAMS